MDPRPAQRPRQGLHGLVSRRTRVLRVACLLGVAGLLVAGLLGGLWRAGVPVALPAAAGWHALLMIGGFMGTVIGIERAVAVRLRWAWAAPAASATGALVALTGWAAPAWPMLVASAVFVAVNGVVVARQRAAHTLLLLLGAVAWFIGNAGTASGLALGASLPWWFAFLVLTVAAERLEMTRLMRRRPGASALLAACVALLLAGAAASALSPPWGGRLYGLALLGLGAWLLRFDIARRTVAAQGLSRYMAVCLLLGHAWLLVAGAAWFAMASGWGGRDIALHALGLGFLFSMILGHAPVMLPALAGLRLRFGAVFYAPLVLLHGSLLLRLLGAAFDARGLAAGALFHVAAIAAFGLTMAGAVLASRP